MAELARLTRNVHFLTDLFESNVLFKAADMPAADKTILHLKAALAEWKRDQISALTKAAL